MPSSAPPPESRRVAVIGAGAVGAALAERLAKRGYAVEAVISRRRAQAQTLAEKVGAAVASDAPEALPAEVRLVFCCVPDDALSALAGTLAVLPHRWPACVVAHTSGAHTARALAPLAAQGAATMSFHPMQTFTRRTGPEAFSGIYCGLEGNARAVEVGRCVAADLGAQSVVLEAASKVRYHLAASVASNFFVTLMALAGEILVDSGMEEATAQALLRPLVDSTWRRLAEESPEQALTGPILRGDVDTVAAHLSALRAHQPQLTPFYSVMAAETVQLARREGSLAPERAESILSVLHAAAQTGAPESF